MGAYWNEDFLLNTGTARELYHTYAEDMPIADYHCHIEAEDIYADRPFANIAELWLGKGGSGKGDHYKWRLMRAFGVEEAYITGTADDEARFVRWIDCVSRAIGNPLLHWTVMELKRYFDYDGPLKAECAKELFAHCNRKLRSPAMRPRQIIRRSGVRLLCTTDDPVSGLEFHGRLAAERDFPVKVLPCWRPDGALDIAGEGYRDWLRALEAAAGGPIRSLEDLRQALTARMQAFHATGCRISDHGLPTVPDVFVGEGEAAEIFARRLAGQPITPREVRAFRTWMMLFLGKAYRRMGWAMQLHMGVLRNGNTRGLRTLGRDGGYDGIGDPISRQALTALLDALDREDALPKTLLYSVDPNENTALEAAMGSFQSAGIRGKLQHGSAWWFNDHFDGMRRQLRAYASQGALATFVGMLTDSRSFTSYVRHEYFRRILCRQFGEWMEEEGYPLEKEAAGRMIEDICYNNAVTYFDLPLEPFRH